MSSVPDIRRKCGASACVKAVRAEFPRFDRYLLSKCEHPEDYGVKLMPNAEARIKALEAAGAPKPENRKKRRRYCFRLTDSGAEALQRLCEAIGCATVQSLCERLFREEAARNGIQW